MLSAMAAGCSGSSSSGSTPGTYQLTIPSGSMEPTLKQGQAIVVTRVPTDYQPHRGDVVVFHDPGGWLSDHSTGDILIKRIVGLPGDDVQCPQAQGQVVVNGSPLAEPYVAPGNTPCEFYVYDARIPPAHLWVLGDHREVSVDSAEHFRVSPASAFVPVTDVIAVYKG